MHCFYLILHCDIRSHSMRQRAQAVYLTLYNKFFEEKVSIFANIITVSRQDVVLPRYVNPLISRLTYDAVFNSIKKTSRYIPQEL